MKVSMRVALVLVALGLSFLTADLAAAVERPPRPTARMRPTRRPRPGRGTPTLAVVTPTPTPPAPAATATATPTIPVSTGCRAIPPHAGDTRLGHIYYAYPGIDRTLRGDGTWRLPSDSNGIDFANETGSLSLLDMRGGLMIEMTDLHFASTGAGYVANTSQGTVSVQGIPGGYSFGFQFNNPTDLVIPPDLFNGAQHICLQIGDDGAWERFVCQIKNGGGFLCHE